MSIIYKIIIFAFSCILNLNANNNENITLHLDWLHQFQFAGYYVAKEKGYYSSYNLDVQIKEFNKDSDIRKELQKEGNYSIGRSSLVLDLLKGKELILLSAIFQSSPLVLISLEESNIKALKDLKNRRLMVNNDMLSLTIQSIIKSQGIEKERITIQEHSFKLEDLINKKTDAMACYLSNEPFILENKGIIFNTINPANYGFDFYEGILYTSQNELIHHSKRVEDFNYASLKGWEYAFNHIEETAQLIYEKYNTQNKSLAALIYEGKVLKELSKIDIGYLGDIDSKKINEIKRFYNLIGLNQNNNNFDVDSVIWKKNKILLNEEEENYLNRNNFTLLVENGKVPFSFNLINKLKGLEIDFWELIISKINIPFTIEKNSLDQSINVSSKSVITRFVYGVQNISNKNNIITKPIAQIPIVFATTDEKDIITDLSALKDINVGVVSNLELFEILKIEYPSINFIHINSTNDGIIKIKNNDIYTFIDNIYDVTDKLHKNNSKFIKINSQLKYKLNVFLEVNENNQLFINILNRIISKLTREEKLEILKKYEIILYTKEFDYAYLLKIIIPLFIILSIFMFFYFKLNIEIKKRKIIEEKLNIKILEKRILLNDNKKFIADTVHQIKTPLANIMMNCEMIKLCDRNNKSEEYIEQIDASINMLTNSYEDLSYITSYDIIEYKPSKLNITNLLKQRIKFFDAISKVNYRKLVLNTNQDYFIYINEIELERIIDNNISNAIKYGEIYKSISINLFENEAFICLEFKTFGNPIKNIENIFNKSYRENKSKRGLGLGLNMVKRICEKYSITYKVKYEEKQNIFIYMFKKSF